MVYQVLVSMILMGLLTGIMTNALSRAQLQEAVTTILKRAQVRPRHGRRRQRRPRRHLLWVWMGNCSCRRDGRHRVGP